LILVLKQPGTFGKAVTRAWKKIEEAGAKPEYKDFLMLSAETSFITQSAPYAPRHTGITTSWFLHKFKKQTRGSKALFKSQPSTILARGSMAAFLS
jgi:hypothetical protein